ncbi:MAG: diphosphate--fructose-6-phosphate 1-phosphotransferase [Deltaproteobacteria bacterium RBG_13_60_28]|nr:MAG: diphosphate--fructose-6-phosphate 1-phosphotransferase [Deltaproteobacteria bacterium RBG_13_60_28]
MPKKREKSSVLKGNDRIDTRIPRLGEPRVDSPIKTIPMASRDGRVFVKTFVEDTDQVLVDDSREYMSRLQPGEEPLYFEMAGPRARIYFDPSKVHCAIATCGGLCPGTNDVIRAIVLELHYLYNVRHIYGVRYGFQGFIPKYGHDLMELKPDRVVDIHTFGGTILSSSRGPQDIGEIVDALDRDNIRILFLIGGDGTLRAADQICEEINHRELRIAVIVIPKTIDNDITFVSRSFGFDTAVEMATDSIRAAHTEALGAPNGIGLVKLMGRYSGFIAANAVLALREVNFVLVPEADFDLEGENGLLKALEDRLRQRGHAVVVVAEGVGQKYFNEETLPRDPSGNLKPGDIGVFLSDRIKDYFQNRGMELNLKYIDPSYLIRSMPANYNDSIYCGFLGQNAVHAGMAGKTAMLVSRWHGHYVHIPIKAAVGKPKELELDSPLWRSVLESTGQPSLKNF